MPASGYSLPLKYFFERRVLAFLKGLTLALNHSDSGLQLSRYNGILFRVSLDCGRASHSQHDALPCACAACLAECFCGLDLLFSPFSTCPKQFHWKEVRLRPLYLMCPSLKSLLFSSHEYSMISQSGRSVNTRVFFHAFVKILGSSTVTS